MQVISYSDIDVQEWQDLVDKSPTATWFQTPEAYAFYSSMKEELDPFFFAVKEDNTLSGLIIGYILSEKNIIKKVFTRRAIIYGGPLLALHITENALITLLHVMKKALQDVIYIETRNFNDYSRWKSIFEQCGFIYQPHLNFHVDTSSLDIIQSNIGRHRWRYIRLSLKNGVKIISNPTVNQVSEYYDILSELYRKKVKTPLYSREFFERLYKLDSVKYILVELDGKVVGGTVCVFLNGRVVYEWYASGIETCRDDVRPLSVAIWGELLFAVEKDCPIFDFMGAGVPGEPYGVRDFKSEFGGKQVEYGRFLYKCNSILYWIGKLGVKWLRR